MELIKKWWLKLISLLITTFIEYILLGYTLLETFVNGKEMSQS